MAATSLAFHCTPATFRPVALSAGLRWLEPTADYARVAAVWRVPLTQADWLQFHADGYRYAGLLHDDTIIALGARWQYAASAGEVAAIWTAPAQRRRGHATAMVALLTAHLHATGCLATCHTAPDNHAMQATVRRVGFVLVPGH